MKKLVLALALLTFTISANQLEDFEVRVNPGDPSIVDFSITHYGEQIHQWQEPDNVTEMLAMGDKFHPRVVTDFEDHRHVVYIQNDSTPENPRYCIYYVVVSPEGWIKAWKRISGYSDTTQALWAAYPDIAMDVYGNSYLVWMEKDMAETGKWKILYQKWQFDGVNELNPLGPKVTVNNQGQARFIDPYLERETEEWVSGPMMRMGDSMTLIPKFAEHPCLMIDDWTRDVHIVWGDDRTGSYEVYYQKQNDYEVMINDKPISGGSPLPRKIPIAQDGAVAPNHNNICPALYCDGFNRAHIVWQKKSVDGNQIFYEWLDEDGEILTNNRLLCPGATPEICVKIRPPGMTTCYLTWMMEHEGNWEIFVDAFRPYDPQEEILFYRVSEAKDHSMYPQIVFYSDPPDFLFLTWQDSRHMKWQIYGSGIHEAEVQDSITKGYALVGRPVRVTYNPSHDRHPAVTITETGPDLKYESGGDILNSAWNPMEYIELVLVNEEDTTCYPLAPIGNPDTVTDYVVQLGLEDGDYSCWVEAKNSQGETATEPYELSIPGGGAQSVDLERRVVFSTYAYPNPLTTSTDIYFALPIDSRVRLEIYSVAGQLMETLVNEPMGAGCHSVNWKAENVPSGIYFCRLQTEDQTATKKITVIK